MKVFDCVIIGGGIVGTSILQRLSEYNLSVALLEKTDDVAGGASKANSGIVHAGYDCTSGTLKAKFNVEGNALFHKLCPQFDVPFLNCGSLVVAEETGLDQLMQLKNRGQINGVETEILDRKQILQLEPNVSPNIAYALYAKSAGIVSPYKFCIAMADNAVQNGAQIFTECEIKSIQKKDKKFVIDTNIGTFMANILINAAGGGAEKINKLVGAEAFDIQYRTGEYLLLDTNERSKVNTVIFPLPTERGKGILVAPTVDGNVIYGPTSTIIENYTTATTQKGIDEIKSSVAQSYANANFKSVIRVYAGVRSICGDDFVVKFSDKIEGFFMLLGICSPGITASPAIALYVANIIAKRLGSEKKQKVEAPLMHKKFSKMSDAQLQEMIIKDKAWGRIVCRCETVSEAEVIQAIHAPLPAKSLDAIKRRTRCGMGRCQGGFCSSRILEILARELSLDFTQINKNSDGTNIAVCKIKEGDYEL